MCYILKLNTDISAMDTSTSWLSVNALFLLLTYPKCKGVDTNHPWIVTSLLVLFAGFLYMMVLWKETSTLFLSDFDDSLFSQHFDEYASRLREP